MVWRGLSDRVISSGRGDGDKNGGCPILTPKVEGNIGVPAAPGRSTSGAAAGRRWTGCLFVWLSFQFDAAEYFKHFFL
jgi:hypothetical protein